MTLQELHDKLTSLLPEYSNHTVLLGDPEDIWEAERLICEENKSLEQLFGKHIILE